jgi:hypothetical protein
MQNYLGKKNGMFFFHECSIVNVPKLEDRMFVLEEQLHIIELLAYKWADQHCVFISTLTFALFPV